MGGKVSIVIPVYGTEKYLERCIESVIDQNYQELEIIVINDCSPGNAEEIISRYLSDGRIKYIKHEQNKGLFLARLTGAKAATGDYIAFLDSDDYVAFDYYYSLAKKIQEEDADIAIGKTVREFEDGSRYILSLHESSLNFERLEGDEVRERYFGQQGRCFAWHTIWNKLYRKELWDKCFPYYLKIDSHVIMTEDVAFSSVLFYFARRVVTVDSSAYFYCVNDAASTNSQNTTLTKFCKNVQDITTVFGFVSEFLASENVGGEIVNNFDSFRSYYAGMWLALAREKFAGTYRAKAVSYVHKLDPKADELDAQDNFFFDSVVTKWHGGIEVAKSLIRDPAVKYVSFDIFDTLITRPLYKPEQVFELLDYEFRHELGVNISFAMMRKEAEAHARQLKGRSEPECQDVTLDEIYEAMETSYQLGSDITGRYKERERELEIELSERRRSARDLFDLAQALGKEVIIVSDMYLDVDTVRRILKKNGYTGYAKLYLSSDIGLTKHTGDLFKYVLNDLGCPPDEILHIGDTWDNDYINPGKAGIRLFFFPKCREVFENIIQGQKTNRCASIGSLAACGVIQQDSYRGSLGYGAMMSVVANKYFDNPYRTFHQDSDFNIDPYFIGYYPVGMHIFGFAYWLIQESRKYGYKKLYFMSRDGHLPLLVYRTISRLWPDAPEAEYIYSSRKALMPFIMKNSIDLYDFPTVVTNQSPCSMKEMLAFCVEEINEESYKSTLKKNGIRADRKFIDRDDYNTFIRVFIEEFYSEAAHEQSKQLCRDYYSMIEKDSATVDMGYSGRIQGALCAAVGRGVDVFFVHADAEQYAKEQDTNDFTVHSFYEFTPSISGVAREHIFSSSSPSCIGFEKKGNMVVPVFEREEKAAEDRLIAEKIHEGAVDFADDLIRKFGDFCKLLPIKPIEVSLPYEGFLRYANSIDLQIFKASYFEDEVWGGLKKINIADFLMGQQAELDRRIEPSLTSLIAHEKKVVMLIKKKFKKYPKVYRLLKKIYQKLIHIASRNIT